MRPVFALVLFALAVALPAASGAAAAPAEADAVRMVLTANPIPAEVFATSFLDQLPATRVAAIRDQITAALGTFERLSGANGRYTAYYSRGTLKVLVHIDGTGKIDSLFFRQPTVTGGNIDDVLAPFKSLPGSSSYVLLRSGSTLRTFNGERALGVGSTFKLAVLAALRAEIAKGTRRWNDVVRLEPGSKSLPSGVLQSWPDGTPLTLATLATEMISISDNTAADSLIRLLGRKAIRPYGGSNVPFLTTREMFLLKTKGNETLRARFQTGNQAQRAAVLAELDRLPLPNGSALDSDPALSAIEWHFTNAQLCSLMSRVDDLPLMSVNPGVADPAQWKRVAYKGGSDWGVISMATWLESRSGANYCFSATWNDTRAAVDETKFSAMYLSVVAALAGLH